MSSSFKNIDFIIVDIRKAISINNLHNVKIMIQNEKGFNKEYLLNQSLIYVINKYPENRDIIYFLLEEGANVNFLNSLGLTYAIYDRDFSLVKILINNGANLGIDEDGHSSVMDALLLSYDEDITPYILEKLSNIDINTKSIIYMLDSRDYVEPGIIRAFLNAGIDINIDNGIILEKIMNGRFIHNNRNERMLILNKMNDEDRYLAGLSYESLTKYLVIKLLLDEGADLHLKNDKVLRLAVKQGDLLYIKLLLDYGADINVNQGVNLLWAIQNYKKSTINFLIDKGADIHVKNEWALRYASKKNQSDIMIILLENGADVHVNNDSPLFISIDMCNLSAVKVLISYGANVNARYNTALLESLTLYKKFLKYINIADNIVKSANQKQIALLMINDNAKLTPEIKTMIKEINDKDISDAIRYRKFTIPSITILTDIEKKKGVKPVKEMAKWQTYCKSFLDKKNISELKEISKAAGLKTKNLSKGEICKQLAEQMVSLNEYDHECINEDNFELTPFSEIPPSCVIKDSGYCFDIDELLNNNFNENPYTRQPFSNTNIRELAEEQKQQCIKDRKLREIHRLEPISKINPKLQAIRNILIQTETVYIDEILKYDRNKLQQVLMFINNQLDNKFTEREIENIENETDSTEYLFKLLSLLRTRLHDDVIGLWLNEYQQRF